MLALTLVAPIALTAPPEGPSTPLTEYLDEACADLPEGACAPLYRLADALHLLVTRGSIEAGSWCCGSCEEQAKVGGGTKLVCTNCAGGGKVVTCGSIRFASRPVHVDCPGMTTSDDNGTVTCY